MCQEFCLEKQIMYFSKYFQFYSKNMCIHQWYFTTEFAWIDFVCLSFKRGVFIGICTVSNKVIPIK